MTSGAAGQGPGGERANERDAARGRGPAVPGPGQRAGDEPNGTAIPPASSDFGKISGRAAREAAVGPANARPEQGEATLSLHEGVNPTARQSPGASAQPTLPTTGGSTREIPVPRRVGRFDVNRVLGRGGCGTVYLATDSQLKRPVAIKVLGGRAPGVVQSSAALQREAMHAAQLRHPGIVAIHDVGQTPEGDAVIVMEYVEGKSLFDVMRSGRMAPRDAAALVAEISEAVHHAHLQGLVHRDLKPGNVLLDAQGKPHVADFGLAVHEDTQRQQAGEVAGTLPYMAPEQVAGETHRLDGRTDIWALGVILYEMLTGRRPFHAESSVDLLDDIQHRDAKPPRQIDDRIPGSLERICLKCLAKRVTDRYTTALDLATELRSFLAGSDGEPGATPRTGKNAANGDTRFAPALAQRLGTRGVVVAVAVTVLLLVVCTWAIRARRERGRVANQNAADPAVQGKQEADGAAVGPGLGKSSTATDAAANAPLTCELLPRVWSDDPETPKRGLRIDGRGALPVHEHDRVHVEVTLNRAAYVYLLWLDTKGNVRPLYPWDGKRGFHKLPDAQQPMKVVHSPAPLREGWPIDGSFGLETVILLARSTPLPADVDLEKLIGKIGPSHRFRTTEYTVLTIDAAGRHRKVGKKLYKNIRIQKETKPLHDHVWQVLERLRGEFELLQAVRFAHSRSD